MNSVGASAPSSSASAALTLTSSVRAAIGRSPAPSGFGKRDGAGLVLRVEDRAARDLVPVVVFSIDPEHGHDRRAQLALGAPRELNGGDGLQEGEQRTAEQAGLLPGDDGRGVGVGEKRGGCLRFGRGATPGLLCRDRSGDLGVLARAGPDAPRGLAPRLRRLGIAGIQRRHVREVERVVARQRPHPWEPAHVDCEAGRRACCSRGRCVC